MLCLVGSLTSIIGRIVASYPQLGVTNIVVPHYKVNERGDLTIQFSGKITGVSPSMCDFSLKIPESFEIPRQADGSAVLEILNNGSPLAISLLSDSFNTTFALITHNSTVLPYDYVFEVSSNSMRHTTTIVPEWPSFASPGGGGAGIMAYDPYITEFYPYYSFKGYTEHVKTYIFNPSSLARTVSDIKYKIKAYDYDNWVSWTKKYVSYQLIQPYTTIVEHDYLDYIFTAPSSGKKYALNSGDYKVTTVKAYGSDWDDTYYPPSSGEFEVIVQSGTHPVFVVYLTNDEFRSKYGDAATYINAASIAFESLYQIYLHPVLEFDWDPSSSLSVDDLRLLSRQVAKTSLGLTDNWKKTNGSHFKNHGFDVLAGFTGYRSDHCGIGSKNSLVVTGGNSLIELSLRHIDNVFQHELSHCYGASNRLDLEWWDYQPSVMSLPGGFLIFTSYGTLDSNIMYPRRYQFDGA